MTELYVPPPFDPMMRLYRCPLAMLRSCPKKNRCFHAVPHSLCGYHPNWCNVHCTHTLEEETK